MASRSKKLNKLHKAIVAAPWDDDLREAYRVERAGGEGPLSELARLEPDIALARRLRRREQELLTDGTSVRLAKMQAGYRRGYVVALTLSDTHDHDLEWAPWALRQERTALLQHLRVSVHREDVSFLKQTPLETLWTLAVQAWPPDGPPLAGVLERWPTVRDLWVESPHVGELAGRLKHMSHLRLKLPANNLAPSLGHELPALGVLTLAAEDLSASGAAALLEKVRTPSLRWLALQGHDLGYKDDHGDAIVRLPQLPALENLTIRGGWFSLQAMENLAADADRFKHLKMFRIVGHFREETRDALRRLSETVPAFYADPEEPEVFGPPAAGRIVRGPLTPIDDADDEPNDLSRDEARRLGDALYDVQNTQLLMARADELRARAPHGAWSHRAELIQVQTQLEALQPSWDRALALSDEVFPDRDREGRSRYAEPLPGGGQADGVRLHLASAEVLGSELFATLRELQIGHPHRESQDFVMDDLGRIADVKLPTVTSLRTVGRLQEDSGNRFGELGPALASLPNLDVIDLEGVLTNKAVTSLAKATLPYLSRLRLRWVPHASWKSRAPSAAQLASLLNNPSLVNLTELSVEGVAAKGPELLEAALASSLANQLSRLHISGTFDEGAAATLIEQSCASERLTLVDNIVVREVEGAVLVDRWTNLIDEDDMPGRERLPPEHFWHEPAPSGHRFVHSWPFIGQHRVDCVRPDGVKHGPYLLADKKQTTRGHHQLGLVQGRHQRVTRQGGTEEGEFRCGQRHGRWGWSHPEHGLIEERLYEKGELVTIVLHTPEGTRTSPDMRELDDLGRRFTGKNTGKLKVLSHKEIRAAEDATEAEASVLLTGMMEFLEAQDDPPYELDGAIGATDLQLIELWTVEVKKTKEVMLAARYDGGDNTQGFMFDGKKVVAHLSDGNSLYAIGKEWLGRRSYPRLPKDF